MTRVLRPSLPGSEVAFTTPVCFSKNFSGEKTRRTSALCGWPGPCPVHAWPPAEPSPVPSGVPAAQRCACPTAARGSWAQTGLLH